VEHWNPKASAGEIDDLDPDTLVDAHLVRLDPHQPCGEPQTLLLVEIHQTDDVRE
jgi:hypothetical protein